MRILHKWSRFVFLFVVITAILIPVNVIADDAETQRLKEEVRQLKSENQQFKQRLERLESLLLNQNQSAQPEKNTVKKPETHQNKDKELVILNDPEKLQRESDHTKSYADILGETETVAEDKPEKSLTIGGAFWLNYANKSWQSKDEGKKGGFNFDMFRLDVDATQGDFILDTQWRFYSYMNTIHHGWIGYKFEEDNQVELGVTQVPFGLRPWMSHNYFFSLGYYIGLEDDYDAGIKWTSKYDNLDLELAYFRNEELGDASNFERYSVDVAVTDEQRNEEVDQFNAVVRYTMKHSQDFETEFGLSGLYGGLYNRDTHDTGDHWATAAHLDSKYKYWNLELQWAKYAYNPESPDSEDPRLDHLITFSNLASSTQVAAKGDLYVFNITRDFNVDWGPISHLNCYNDYSYIDKKESSFKDSQLNTTGCLVTAGPTLIYVDIINGKNAWYLNDPSGTYESNMGTGGNDDWETRFNINFEYYF